MNSIVPESSAGYHTDFGFAGILLRASNGWTGQHKRAQGEEGLAVAAYKSHLKRSLVPSALVVGLATNMGGWSLRHALRSATRRAAAAMEETDEWGLAGDGSVEPPRPCLGVPLIIMSLFPHTSFAIHR